MGGRWAAASGGLAVMIGAVLPVLSACSGDPPEATPTPTTTQRQADRDRLAGLAAAAKDKRYVARYVLTAAKRADRTVTVALATDGSWVVAVPGGAFGGLADIAMFSSADGLFQCLIGPANGAGTRPDLASMATGCVRVSKLTAAIDPRVQHIFTDWIDPLTDRATALSVASTRTLPGARGSCFSVESNSAALAPPVDPGVYCYDSDGVLTAASVGFGTLKLVGDVAAAPPGVVMPGPVVTRAPLPTKAPPAPTTSAAPASASPG